MGVFTKLFRHQEEARADESDVECRHSVLVPRWRNPADMGHTDRVSTWVCGSCGELVSAERAR